MQDELLDIVDSTDTVTGTILRSQYDRLEKEKLGYIRAVEMFIVNDEGQLWIPTRTAHKKIAPDGLDYSMGGHVSSGETYIESALREIKEELNLELQASDLILVHKFPPSVIPYFRAVYLYRSNQAPSYNPTDYVSAEWLSPQQLLDKLDSGNKAKLSLRESADLIRCFM